MAKFFVGLNFSNDGLLSRKILGFRKRFDPKFNQYSFAHMSLLAPFEVDSWDIENLTETLKEEVESFFYNNFDPPMLAFTGVGIHEYNRKHLLYLNPDYGTDLQYCSDLVQDICYSFISKRVKYKENIKQFLPLGIFQNPNDLHVVLENAKMEFQNNGEIPIVSISLYEQKMGIWFEKEVLVSFEENMEQLLQLSKAAI